MGKVENFVLRHYVTGRKIINHWMRTNIFFK